MCTHLATGAGTSWLCRALQQNSGRGSHQLQKAGGSEERQEKAAQRHVNSKKTKHILSESEIEKSERHASRQLKYPIHMSF